MKHLLSSALIGLLISSQALAGLPPTTSKGQSDASKSVTFNLQAPYSQMTRVDGTTALIETGNNNVLSNPNGIGTAGWAASGGSLSNSGTAPGTYLTWDSSAAAQTLSSGYVTIASGDQLSGKNGVVSCDIETPSGTATHTLEAFDGTNKLVSNSISTVSTGYTRNSANFTFPASGTVRLQLSAVNANEPLIRVRGCYFGVADGFNVSQISQATKVGTITISGCTTQFTFPTTTFAWNDTTGAGCTYTATGSLSAPSSQYLGFRAALSAGEYLVVPGGGPLQNGSAAGYLRMSNGTINSLEAQTYTNATAGGVSNYSPGTFSFSVATAQAASDYRIQENHSAGGALVFSSNGAVGSTATQTFTVYRFPTASQQVYGPDATAASWTGSTGSCSGTAVTSTTYANLVSTGCALSTLGNTNFGTVTASGTSIGFTFTPPKAGAYFACATTSIHDASAANVALQLTDGTTTIGETMGVSSAAASLALPATVCGRYSVNSTASKSIYLQAKSSAGALDISSSYSPNVYWTIFQLDAAQSVPLLVGSVTSNTSGLERIERARIASGCASINSQSGSWVSSISHTATGQCTFTVSAGIFSSQPTCQVISEAGNARFGSMVPIWGSSQLRFDTFSSIAANPTFSDMDFGVICMGAR